MNNKKLELTELQLFWKNLYKKYFNLDIDTSLIQEREGKCAIFIAKGLTIQQVYEALPFKKWKYADGDLDTAVPTNDRASEKNYVVYVDQNIEVDEQLNESVEIVRKTIHIGITVLECLVLGLKHFVKTGNHFSLHKIILCSGSGFFNGDVPSVDFEYGTLRVDRFRTSLTYDRLRPNEVVFT